MFFNPYICVFQKNTCGNANLHFCRDCIQQMAPIDGRRESFLCKLAKRTHDATSCKFMFA